jgi:hypothetical protein
MSNGLAWSSVAEMRDGSDGRSQRLRMTATSW